MDRRSFRRLDLLRSLLLRLFVPFLFRDFLSRKISSAQVRVDGFEQFVEHGFGFGFLAAAQRFCGAVMEVIAHEISRDASQSFLDAGDLRDDIGAVAILFNHFLEAANLAFDAPQALEVSGF